MVLISVRGSIGSSEQKQEILGSSTILRTTLELIRAQFLAFAGAITLAGEEAQSDALCATSGQKDISRRTKSNTEYRLGSIMG